MAKKTKSSDVALKVEHVSKSFRLPTEQASGIKQAFINRMRGIKGYKEQHVLKDISFEVKKGDFFGIVGRNGSGKSTLLKIISQIYAPDSGKITVNGSLVPFIELGVGFNPELTGRENVYLNGAMLGFSKDEVSEIYDDIVDFAELEEFMDQKLKNYSSGMQVRLAFSVAIKAQGDILVLDEVLAVGDEAFQRKCDNFFAEIKKDKNKTVILVTHSMESVRKYCTRAMMVRDGKLVAVGDPEDVANECSLENTTSSTKKGKGSGYENIKNIEVKLLSPAKVTEKDEVKIQIKYRLLGEKNTKILINLLDIDRQVPLYASSSGLMDGVVGEDISKIFSIRLEEINNTNIGIALSIRDENGEILAFPNQETLPTFIFRRSGYKNPANKDKIPYAILFKRGEWR